ncbi:MAG: CDP-alcohol phosphatidyltransferase family protein [Gemmatimonadetes bacterium]|nr:CDP-alcohol phosphatidyltransferase family protein [Gemmatimonadota bacterium]
MTIAKRGPLARAAPDVVAGLVVLAAPATATWALLDLPATYLLQALALYGVVGGLVLAGRPPALPGPGLGGANRVTLARSTLVVSLTPLVIYPSVHNHVGHWWIILIATLALVLDGVDGWLARKTGGSSAFGARFDMELDAFLILVLAVLVWLAAKAGPGVILIGAMRYGFVAASWVWPALQGELPPSLRRKTVCVVQGIVLLVCLGPIIPRWFSYPIAWAALILLAYSFAADVLWLVRENDRAQAGGSVAATPTAEAASDSYPE